MTNLSLPAQAVLNEMVYQLAGEALRINLSANAAWAAAAVLRQLADTVPQNPAGPTTYYTSGLICQHIRDLADELVNLLPGGYHPPTRPRPKPPSLKGRALALLDEGVFPWPHYKDTIRKALEELPDDLLCRRK